jgi:hypothetical protein
MGRELNKEKTWSRRKIGPKVRGWRVFFGKKGTL